MNRKNLLLIYVVLLLFGCHTAPCSFNVDKIEVMTHCNIPILSDNFYCDKINNVKVTCFELDSDALKKTTMSDWVDYANRYHFKQSNVIEGRRFIRTLEHNSLYFKLVGDGGKRFFKKEGNTKQVNWKVFLDVDTGKMWVRVEDNV